MRCAIELIFDTNSQNILRQLRKRLSDNGVHDEATPLSHVTIADIEIGEERIEETKRIVSEFAATHTRLPLVLSQVGSFMTKENVLFYAPTVTEELVLFNEEMIRLLGQHGVECGRYYTKDNWVPHCTLAIRLTDAELKKGFGLLKDNSILPLAVTCDKIDILCYDPRPYKQLACYPLK